MNWDGLKVCSVVCVCFLASVPRRRSNAIKRNELSAIRRIKQQERAIATTKKNTTIIECSPRTVNFLMSGLYVFRTRAIVHVQLVWLNDLMCVLFVACGYSSRFFFVRLFVRQFIRFRAEFVVSICFIFCLLPQVYAMVNYSSNGERTPKCYIVLYSPLFFFLRSIVCFKLEICRCVCALQNNLI